MERRVRAGQTLGFLCCPMHFSLRRIDKSVDAKILHSNVPQEETHVEGPGKAQSHDKLV